jgi:hypothetical protein
MLRATTYFLEKEFIPQIEKRGAQKRHIQEATGLF